MDSHLPAVTETVTKINSEPRKTNSTYGNWVVYADATFNNGSKQWEYPNKAYFFFTKKSANEFINNNQLVAI